MECCKICDSETLKILETSVLNKYDVSYYQCLDCNFIQPDKEYWLDEAYESAITKQDVGLLYRNYLFTHPLQAIIKYGFTKNGKFLDFGGGYGIFVRLMRDNGFNFFRFDTYCKNIFAEGFDGPLTKYELVTAFEVFEHFQNPHEEIQKILNLSENIFFSTELIPENIQDIKKWWYLMPETGQHVSLYSKKSLEKIAEKYGLNLYTNNQTLHLLTKNKLNSRIVKLLLSTRYSKLYNFLIKNPNSLLQSDYLSTITTL